MLTVYELIEYWVHAYLSGDDEKAKDLFENQHYNNKSFNRVSSLVLPEGLDINDYIIDIQIDRCELINNNKYETFFRLDINMEFEGSVQNCDYSKFKLIIISNDDKYKISQIEEVACYPWELEHFKSWSIGLGKLYLYEEVLTSHVIFIEMLNEANTVLNKMFNELYLRDMKVVVFPTSDALCKFLGINVTFGEIGGKAKADHLFIVDYNCKEALQRSIQHEICHIALERVVGDCGFLNPCLNEALAELAGLSFVQDEVKKRYRALLKYYEYDVCKLENLNIRTVDERTTQIMLAASLLHFLISKFGSEKMWSFIIESTIDGSLTRSVKEIGGMDVNEFNRLWKEFAENGV